MRIITEKTQKRKKKHGTLKKKDFIIINIIMTAQNTEIDYCTTPNLSPRLHPTIDAFCRLQRDP